MAGAAQIKILKMEGQYISFYKNDVTLEIWVDEELRPDKNLFGSITVSSGQIGAEEAYWDNLSYFLNLSKKEFKKECKEELVKLGFSWKEVYIDMVYLLDKAKKLGLL